MNLLTILKDKPPMQELALADAEIACPKPSYRKSRTARRRGHMGNGGASRSRDRFSISRF